MDGPYNIMALLLLLIGTAYFVAAEFAFVKVRSSRIEQLVIQGNKKAMNVKKILNNLDGYLSACQLGITITALGIGWLGEPTFQRLMEPLFKGFALSETLTHTISFIIAFSIITFVHVVFGELAPKSIAIQKAEIISMRLSGSMIFFHKLMYPLIWSLNGSANLIIRSLGLGTSSEHSEEHSEEEIKLIVSSSTDINIDEKSMVEKIFDFDETIAREIMVHRKDMECVFLTDSIEHTIEQVKNSSFSRFPVCGEDRDDIKGYVNLRDVFTFQKVNEIVREVPKVLETTPIKKVLKRLQKEKTQLAIVLDEYGGISGMITIEDIVEEIVGDIQDEFDNELPPIRKEKDKWLIEGDVHIEDVEKAINYIFADKKDYVTIGGYIMGNIESENIISGKQIAISGINIEIIKAEDNRILLISINH